VETAASPDHYVPGRDPASITPWHLLQALRHHGDQDLGNIIALHDPLTARLMAQVEEAQQQAAGTCSIPQWLATEEKTSDAERNPA
jgi:hypothetical protein